MKRNIVKYLLMMIIPVLTLVLAVGYVYAWFISDRDASASLGDGLAIFTPPPVYFEYADCAYYKYQSAPLSPSNTQIHLNPYNYDSPIDNVHNNLFILLEVELLDQNVSSFNLKVQATDESGILTKLYYPCDQSAAMSNVRGAPKYIISGKDYLVYFRSGSTYGVCTDYSLVSYDADDGWSYNGNPCYYSAYYLSDCITVDLCILNVGSISELQNKTSVGNLVGFTGFYDTLTSYFASANPASDSFVTTGAVWTKDTELNFPGTFNANNIKLLNNKRHAYIAINLKYSDDVMNNSHADYKFQKSLNQLFASDIRFVLE